MTLLPTDSWYVEGIPGPKYKVGPKCSVPDCDQWADHAHHLFRRSFLASENNNWVMIPFEGGTTMVGNLTGLCYQHHQQVTDNKDWIKWDHTRGRYVYWRNADVDLWERVGDLDPQPPHSTAEVKYSENRDDGKCPSCKRRLPQPDLPRLPRRQRKTWVVSVPDDSEDGAAVLDTLVEECAKIFERDEHNDFRYFTLVEAMSLLLQEQSRIER